MQNDDVNTISGTPSVHVLNHDNEEFPEYDDAPKFRGRRFLLLTSFAAGVVTLLLTSAMFNIPECNKARLPTIFVFMMVYTAFYSPVCIVPPLFRSWGS